MKSAVNRVHVTKYKCKICGERLSTAKNESLIIDDVPENTFNFSKNTVNLHVIACKSCGAVQLVNVPLSADYDAVYRSIGVSVAYREEKKRQIKKFIEVYNLIDAQVIEIGCGNGQFLEMIREVGIEKITGIEAGANNYHECLNKGFNVFHGNLPRVLKKEKLSNLFDAFVSFHYLEHLPNPINFVTCLYEITKTGGVGLIEVPNYDYIEKNNIWLEFTKDHRFYYRKRTICYLLSKCGFDVEFIEENNGGICLTVIVRKLGKSDGIFSAMRNQIQKDIEEFKLMIEGLKGPFAVYGAGHYSQLLINIAHKQYGIKPVYIFDSNKQKCGNKICDVVIEHGNNAINMQNCDNIIVICGIYNDEVFNMLSSSGKKIIKWE